MRVKSGRRITRTPGPQYVKVKRKGKKKFGAIHLGGAYARAKKPKQIRVMTMETFIYKSVNLMKLVGRYIKARKRVKRFKDAGDWQKVPFGIEPDKRKYNLIEIELNPDGRKFLSALKKLDPLTYHLAVYTLSRGLRMIHSNIRYWARRMIGLAPYAEHGQVPQDTGALRRDLFNSLSSRSCKVPSGIRINHNDLELRIGFYSDLPYVDYLKKPFLHIKHHGKKKSRRTGIPLYDPGAKMQFMKNITKVLQRMAMGRFYTMCREAAPFLGIPADYVKQMFKVKHIRGRLRTL